MYVAIKNSRSISISCSHFFTMIEVGGSAQDFLATSADDSASLAISGFTSLFMTITSFGKWCAGLVTGAWQGLGFLVSSIAAFPVYCLECLQNMWMRSMDYIISLITTTTKETYMAIVGLCLVYLFLSNILRYVYCRGLSLFPRRLRQQRNRMNVNYWQFDRSFESDFENLYGSDYEDPSHMTPVDAGNSDFDDSNSDAEDDSSRNNSNNSGDISDNDSDEYTVVTEDSDTDVSVNSHTFSTESSDHEIDVLLPALDERYSLRSRSSTPSRMPKIMCSPEEFNREMERERDKRMCVVCQSQIKSVLILPCRHMCMCVLCADHIVRSRAVVRRVCPLCRAKIAKVMNVYV